MLRIRRYNFSILKIRNCIKFGSSSRKLSALTNILFLALLVLFVAFSRPCVSKMERNVSSDLVTGQNPTRLSPAKFKTGVLQFAVYRFPPTTLFYRAIPACCGSYITLQWRRSRPTRPSNSHSIGELKRMVTIMVLTVTCYRCLNSKLYFFLHNSNLPMVSTPINFLIN